MTIQVCVVGLDIAKNVFQVHGADRQGQAVLRKRLRRSQVSAFFEQMPPCLVGMEATRSAHYWARVLTAYGHDVRLIAPQFVKPYLKSQKN
jgi:transposase